MGTWSPRQWQPAVTESQSKANCVILALQASPASERVCQLSAAVAKSRGIPLHIVCIVTLPRFTPLDLPQSQLASYYDVVNETRNALDIPTTATIRIGRDHTSILSQVAQEFGAETILLEGGVKHRAKLSKYTKANLLTINEHQLRTEVASILVPVVQSPHSALAVATACAFADITGAWVDLLHVVSPNASQEQRKRAQDFVLKYDEWFDNTGNTSTWVHSAHDVVDTIYEQSRSHDVMVIGSSDRSRLSQIVRESTENKLLRMAQTDTIIAYRTTN